MELRENPPPEFVRLLERCWKKIPTVQGAKLLSADEPEYGCGKFGCVFPTTNPKVVLKLTTDRGEAAFAQYAATNGQPPLGIVKYYKVVRIGKIYCGETYTGHMVKRRPSRKDSGLPLVEGDTVYAIWREAADNVGNTKNYKILDEYAWSVSPYYHKIAPNVTKTLKNLCRGKKYKSLIYQGLEILSSMVEDPTNEEVARAILYYLERGLWIRDVSSNNVGEVIRKGKKTVVITDPGAVTFMIPKPKIGSI